MIDAPEVRAHVRRPGLPWRPADNRTECGRHADDVAEVIERDVFLATLKRDGAKRTAYAVCMTCMETARRWKDWNEKPSELLAREFYGGRRCEDMDDELRAIAMLIEAHREEFDQCLRGLAATVSLAEFGRAKATRVARRPR